MYITQRTPEGFELVIVNSILPGLRTRNLIWNVAFILRQKAPTMNKVYMKKILILQVVSIVENQINPNPKFHVLYLKKSYGMSLNIYQDRQQETRTLATIGFTDQATTSMFVAERLLLGRIELNPGLAAINNCVRIESLNAGSAVNKAPLIRDVISNRSLDILVHIETY